MPLQITTRTPEVPDFKFELLPLHSPLLGQSLLVSFPPLIDMLKFSGYPYLIRGQPSIYLEWRTEEARLEPSKWLVCVLKTVTKSATEVRCPAYVFRWGDPYTLVATVHFHQYHNIYERVCSDARTGMPQGIPRGAMCVQRFDDSLNSAIHITYRISLRSSSIREPRDPLLKVLTCSKNKAPGQLRQLIDIFTWDGPFPRGLHSWSW